MAIAVHVVFQVSIGVGDRFVEPPELFRGDQKGAAEGAIPLPPRRHLLPGFRRSEVGPVGLLPPTGFFQPQSLFVKGRGGRGGEAARTEPQRHQENQRIQGSVHW